MKSVSSILAGVFLVSLTAIQAQGLDQNFNSIPSGTTVASGNVTDWTSFGGDATQAVVLNTAGFPTGNGLQLGANGLSIRYDSPVGSIWNIADGEATFSFNYRQNSGDLDTQVMLMSNDGAPNFGWSGFYLDLSAGNISISNGGSGGPFSPSTESYSYAWTSDMWYTIKVSNFTLNSDANQVVGTLSIVEAANPGNILLDNVTITATGASLTNITTLALRRFGSAGAGEYSQFDNLVVTAAVPEPSTTLAFALGGLFIMVLHRVRRSRRANLG